MKKNESKIFNWTFIWDFMLGVFCLIRAFRIADGQKVTGLLGGFKGFALTINQGLLVCVGIYLVWLPFRIKKPAKLSDMIWSMVFVVLTEIIPSLFS